MVSETAGAAVARVTIPDTPYTILEQPLGTECHVRIVTIGTGASGINMIRTLRTSLTNYTHIVYEKNPKAGGKWYENRYPGCKCDILTTTNTPGGRIRNGTPSLVLRNRSKLISVR
jgi:hypothetical protein